MCMKPVHKSQVLTRKSLSFPHENEINTVKTESKGSNGFRGQAFTPLLLFTVPEIRLCIFLDVITSNTKIKVPAHVEKSPHHSYKRSPRPD